MDVLRPFMLLACVAFTTGFLGYLALARMNAPVPATAVAESYSSTVSAPAADDFNPGKRI